MNRPLRLAALTVITSLAIYAPACGPDDPEVAVEAPPSIDDVIYEIGANDDALASLLAAPLAQDPSKGAVFSFPVDGAALPAGVAPTFAWAVGGSSARWIAPSAPERGGSSLEIFGRERSAEAHGSPVNGKAYFLVFSTPKDDKLLRVFTTSLSYTPDEAAWTKLKTAGAPITASILTATFAKNAVVEGGGPFPGADVTFTVTP